MYIKTLVLEKHTEDDEIEMTWQFDLAQVVSAVENEVGDLIQRTLVFRDGRELTHEMIVVAPLQEWKTEVGEFRICGGEGFDTYSVRFTPGTKACLWGFYEVFGMLRQKFNHDLTEKLLGDLVGVSETPSPPPIYVLTRGYDRLYHAGMILMRDSEGQWTCPFVPGSPTAFRDVDIRQMEIECRVRRVDDLILPVGSCR